MAQRQSTCLSCVPQHHSTTYNSNTYSKGNITKCHGVVAVAKTTVCWFLASDLWSESFEVEGLPYRPWESILEERVGIGRGLEGDSGGQGEEGTQVRGLSSCGHF